MRLLLILIPVALCLVMISVGDFYITHLVKKRINTINTEMVETTGRRLITWQNVVLLGSLFWLIPLNFPPEWAKLEYRIFGTLSYWSLLILTLQRYLRWQKVPAQVRTKALIYLTIPGLGLGIVIVPIQILIL